LILLSILPFTIRNYIIWNRFLLLQSQFGHVFWNGNHPDSKGDFHPYHAYEIPEDVRGEGLWNIRNKSDRRLVKAQNILNEFFTMDPDKYRSQEEKEEWRKKCPIEAFKVKLIRGEIIDQAIIQEIEEDTVAQIEFSVKFSKKSPKPDSSTVLDDIYKNPMNLGGN